jgi:hypothetical protein
VGVDDLADGEVAVALVGHGTEEVIGAATADLAKEHTAAALARNVA